MANAKKCDRCGKYYDENVRFKVNSNGYRQNLSSVTEMATGGYHWKNYDLCDDCISDFKSFIGGRKLAEEE